MFKAFKIVLSSQFINIAFNYIGGYPDDKRNKQVLYLQPDLQIRHGSYGVGYPQVNTLVSSGPNGIIAEPSSALVADPPLDVGVGSVEYHEAGHCLYGVINSMYDGETEAIVNFPYAYVSNMFFHML